MERTAIGFCRLSAADFDTMTPCEVQWRIEAEIERENREFERLAQLAAWVINPWIKEQRHHYRVPKMLKRRLPNQETDWDEWAKD